MSYVNFFPLKEYPLLFDVIVVRLKPAKVVMDDSGGNECLTMWPLKTLKDSGVVEKNPAGEVREVTERGS